MAFQPTPNLPANPDVRIFFVGQLVLEPLRCARGCEVFINRSAPDHHLSIEVRIKRPNRPDEIAMRHFGPLPFFPISDSVPPRHGMFILKTPGRNLVEAYNGANPSTEGEELNLALNMFRIHDVPVGPVEPIGGRPSIFIQEGIFYTADIYPAGATLQKRRWGSLPKPQPKFASVIGANLYLPNPPQSDEQQTTDEQCVKERANDPLAAELNSLIRSERFRHEITETEEPRVVMVWRHNGRDVSLPLLKRPGLTYEIYITNEPLFQDDSIDAPFSHDELSEYYKILTRCPQNEQFILKTPPPTRGSLRTPCMSVLLNQ